MDSSEKPSHTGDPPHPPAGGTIFGLNRSQLHSWGVGAPRDYKARYPPDPHGQGMSSNARIWSIYLDEAADFDANMLAECRDTIDVLLVFAGLFSAVLTTFVVQTSQSMQPDYNEASMLLLFEILKATASNGSQITIPSSPTDFFSPSRSDEWTNSLWFVSLTQPHHCPGRRSGQAVDSPIRRHRLRQLRARSCKNSTYALYWTTDVAGADDHWLASGPPSCFVGTLFCWPHDLPLLFGHESGLASIYYRCSHIHGLCYSPNPPPHPSLLPVQGPVNALRLPSVSIHPPPASIVSIWQRLSYSTCRILYPFHATLYPRVCPLLPL
ncbi:hypothetical protein EDD85DRAFT_249911 [Armillaria nabsnona]|nr:hypothetical protein EDD85DRAFT_249911 [Armillaria nabsnona]